MNKEIKNKTKAQKELFYLLDNPAKVKGKMPKHRSELYEK